MLFRRLSRAVTFVFFPAFFAFSEEPVHLAVIHRIKAEALENSR